MSTARIAAPLAIALLAAGCASLPQADAMRADTFSIARRQPASVWVRASGGQDDHHLRISDAAFERALRDSLVASAVFADVVDRCAAGYRLDVVLGDSADLAGHEMTTLWHLSHVDTRETVWQERVTSHGHGAGVGGARASVERAASENIRLGIERLSRLALEPLPAWDRPDCEPEPLPEYIGW